MDVLEATLRILCMTDGKEGMHTLERQEEFTEIVKSRDVEVFHNIAQQGLNYFNCLNYQNFLNKNKFCKTQFLLNLNKFFSLKFLSLIDNNKMIQLILMFILL